jgi:hypothetical protein
MRSIDMRIPLLAGAAIALLAFSPAKAETLAPQIEFVSGTGEQDETDIPQADEVLEDNATNDSGISKAESDLTELSAKMADPRMQDSLANAVERMTETMLDLPVGKFAAAIEKSIPGVNQGRKRIRANDTLADVAGRDAERLPQQLADGSRQMMGMMSGLASAFATMLPEFEKMGEAMEESMDDFEDALPNR